VKAKFLDFSDTLTPYRWIGEIITHRESHVESHFRLSGGSRSSTPYGPQEIASEKRVDARHDHQLHQYYKKIVQEVQDAEQIFIMGPGEAKVGLKKEIDKSKGLSSRIVGIQPADKMTDSQIAAKVRDFFSVSKV